MDRKGMISGEIIVLLILIVLMIGIIANFTERTSYKITDKTANENLEKQASEFADNLINNPGTPNNWNELKNKNNVIPGLGILNENEATVVNSVDYIKLIALKSDYKNLITKQVFNNDFKSSLTLTPLTGSVGEITLGEDNLENPATVNRLVKCNFLKKYTIGSFEKNGPCNSHHITTHSCNHFKLFTSYLKKMDYYLLFEKNSYNNYYWTIESTEIPGIPKIANTEKIYLNNIIKQKILLNNNGVIFVHINQENPKAVLVSVPKEFDKSKLNYDYFVSTECNLKVQIAGG